jgi:hypothetical protein
MVVSTMGSTAVGKALALEFEVTVCGTPVKSKDKNKATTATTLPMEFFRMQ